MKPSRESEWRLLLLAYSDGELGTAQKRFVEERLARDPASQALLNDLMDTGPANFELWNETEPDEPSDEQWQKATDSIALYLPRAKPRRRFWPILAGLTAMSGLAAMIVVAVSSPAPVVESPKQEVVYQAPAKAIDPLADYAVLPVATASDVMVSAIRGNGAPGFVALDHPIPEVLALATTDDIEVEKIGDTEIWSNEGSESMMIAPKK